MKDLSSFTKRSLDEQGFIELDDVDKGRYQWPLRFTPGISIILIAVGLGLQSPVWLGAMAAVALSGVLLPRAMLLDLVYNFGVRHLFHAPRLPPTPAPRRYSYLISTVLLTSSAVSFHYGQTVLGFFFGGLVCLGGAVLTISLWCFGSWIYKITRRAVAWISGGAASHKSGEVNR